MNRLLTTVLFAVAFTSHSRADNPKDRWIGDVDSALAAAKMRNQPVFLTFRCER